jgi:hypothetical protein
MEDVEAAHSIKPYLPRERFVKFFGFLNFKIHKGWSGEKIAKLIEIAVEGKGDLAMSTKEKKMNALMQYLIQKMKAKKEHWVKDDEQSFLIYLGFAAVIVCAIMMIVGSAYGN